METSKLVASYLGVGGVVRRATKAQRHYYFSRLGNVWTLEKWDLKVPNCPSFNDIVILKAFTFRFSILITTFEFLMGSAYVLDYDD